MNKAATEQSINNILKCFGAKILSTNVLIDGELISWPNYKPGIIKNVVYPREYQLLLDNRQYSILMEDNSFFQFYYEFKNKTLVKSRLAYYPSPSVIKEDIDELEDYEIHANPLLSELYYEMMSEMVYNSGSLSSNSHIRFDYDSSAKSHKKAHLQFGGINNFRITAKSIILPFTFVEKLLLDFQASWFNENIDFNKMNVERNHGVKKCYSFDESDVFFIQS